MTCLTKVVSVEHLVNQTILQLLCTHHFKQQQQQKSVILTKLFKLVFTFHQDFYSYSVCYHCIESSKL